MALKKKLGRRFAELRQAGGLTQAKLAERVGVTTETISRLERGSAAPSLTRVEEIATALGIGLDELFRFRVRDTRKDLAIERLLALVRRRSAEDIEALVDVSARILERWQ